MNDIEVEIDQTFAVPSLDKFVVDGAACVPGKFICRCDEKIILNVGRKIVRLKVVNKADRPIQVILLVVSPFIDNQ